MNESWVRLRAILLPHNYWVNIIWYRPKSQGVPCQNFCLGQTAVRDSLG